MKKAMINYREDWTFWLPDSVADWDAISHWERARLASMEENLQPGDVLFDVGTEHGWLSAVYGSFCGHGNMVLIEPSPEFWPNIRLTWERNGFATPIATVQAFAGERTIGGPVVYDGDWPPCSVGDEIGSMAYRYINTHTDVPTISIDNIVAQAPKGITIDIEGAELLALRGAHSTLIHDRPHVWVSIHPDLMLRDFSHHPDEVHSFMSQHGYMGRLLEVDHEHHWYYRPQEWGW